MSREPVTKVNRTTQAVHHDRAIDALQQVLIDLPTQRFCADSSKKDRLVENLYSLLSGVLAVGHRFQKSAIPIMSITKQTIVRSHPKRKKSVNL